MGNLSTSPLFSSTFTKDKPLWIAGPCSVESPEQIEIIAESLKESGANILRGGIWKPRTRPNSFEGIGEEGLQWLSNAAQKAGLPCATEVANAKHTELALKAGIDILWIGARTTGNPFLVSEIAEVLIGTNTPVMVKNPLNPDIELWIGALERFSKVGIDDLCAIHRGFFSYEKSIYRNPPLWQIPVEVKRRVPQIPIICDPSHISGNSSLVEEISKEALALGFDGLMVEVHDHPEKALSDSSQQITPEQFKRLKESIIIRNKIGFSQSSEESIARLRASIDLVDKTLIETLAQRMELVESIGKLKAQENISVLQADRWSIVLEKIKECAEKNNLDKNFVEKIFNLIHEESMERQIRQ
jgi:chorismate mutase